MICLDITVIKLILKLDTKNPKSFVVIVRRI